MKVLVLLMFFLISCSSKDAEEAKLEDQALSYLNARNYDKAINSYNSLLSRNPSNKGYQIKLAQAYAGCGGFESISFYSTLSRVDKLMDSKDVLNSILNISQLGNNLSLKEEKCLDSSLDLFYKVEDTILNSNAREQNFYWASFHFYNFLNKSKKSALILNGIKDANYDITLEEFGSYLWTIHLDLFSQGYKSYLMMKYSYDSLSQVSLDIDNLFKEYLDNLNLDLLVTSNAEEYRIFLADLIRDNPEIVLVFINSIKDILDYVMNEKRIKSFFEVDTSLDNYILISKKIDMLLSGDSKLSEEERYLVDNFLNNMYLDISFALEESIRNKDFSILKNYLSQSDNYLSKSKNIIKESLKEDNIRNDILDTKVSEIVNLINNLNE